MFKVAAVSGDIRRAVDICYRAAEIRRTGTEKLDRRYLIYNLNAIASIIKMPKWLIHPIDIFHLALNSDSSAGFLLLLPTLL